VHRQVASGQTPRRRFAERLELLSSSVHRQVASGRLRSSPSGWDGEETSPYPIDQESGQTPRRRQAQGNADQEREC